MKGKKLRNWLSGRKKIISGCAAIVLAAVIGGGLFFGTGEEPEFPSYTDPILEVSIQEEETPLASAPKTTTKTTRSTKTTKKTVALKTASKKSYTRKLATKTKVTNSKKTTGNKTIATRRTVVTNTTEKYTRKSKKKLVTSKITTTVKTTTTEQVTVKTAAASSKASAVNTGKYEANITSAAGKMDSRVLSAFQKLGFKLIVDPSVNYSGYFEARSRTITVRTLDTSVYHELGHFLAFIAGNADKTSSFQSIYSAEKSKVTCFNKAYVTQNASEYFAESVREYILSNSALKSSRPKTYAAVKSALNQITDAQVAKIQKVYGSYWK